METRENPEQTRKKSNRRILNLRRERKSERDTETGNKQMGGRREGKQSSQSGSAMSTASHVKRERRDGNGIVLVFVTNALFKVGFFVFVSFVKFLTVVFPCELSSRVETTRCHEREREKGSRTNWSHHGQFHFSPLLYGIFVFKYQPVRKRSY